MRIYYNLGDPDMNIWVMDADGKNPRQLTFHPEWAGYPDWSPDENQIAFDSDWESQEGEPPKLEICVMDADGSNIKPVKDVGFASRPRWSPDGKQVVYAAAFHARVTNVKMIIASLHPSGRTKVFKREEVPLPKMPGMTGLSSVSFGADGKPILFAGRIFGSWEIFRFRLDSHELIQLTDELGADTNPREWNPRLSVPPQQSTIPLFWGAIKSNL